MNIAIIGRSEILYDTARVLKDAGHNISLIITSKEAPEYKKTSDDFKDLAKEYNAEFIQTAKINTCLEIIKNSDSDIAVSINYSSIIPQEVIDCFSLGILNAHGGDLPRYRGNACQAWAILNGEDKIGLCIHRMIGGEVDSGDVVAKDYLPINLSTKILEVWRWMNDRIPSLYLDAIGSLSKDSSYVLEKQSTNPQDVLRCYPRRPEDACIDWGCSAEDVIRLINASGSPYAGAYCFLDGQKLIVYDAELIEYKYNFCAVDGQVLEIGSGYVDVSSYDNEVVRIKMCELDGHIKTPDNFIKSIRKRLS